MSTVMLRQVPGDTVVHRLWAGTKLLAVLAISLLLMFLPTWPVLGMVTVALLVTGIAARVPLGALPRPPWWFWLLMGLGIVVNAPIGGEAILRYLQITVFAFLLLFASMMIAWTTPMNEIAPAISTLGAPLRKLRMPVDEWAVAIALCLRSLPLLMEEMRILRAARQLRPKGGRPQSTRDNGLIDIVTAAMAVAMRRAGELGEAITARGGTGQLTAYESRPGRADAIAFVLIAVMAIAGVVMGVAL
jgi:energy-coupling factor transport system permease protein